MKILIFIVYLIFFTLINGCGFIVEQIRDEADRQQNLTDMTHIIQSIKTKQMVDTLIQLGGDRYIQLNQKYQTPAPSTPPPAPLPPPKPISNNRIFKPNGEVVFTDSDKEDYFPD